MAGLRSKKPSTQTRVPVVIYQGPPGTRNPLVPSPEIVSDSLTSHNSPTPGKEKIAEDAYLIF